MNGSSPKGLGRVLLFLFGIPILLILACIGEYHLRKGLAGYLAIVSIVCGLLNVTYDSGVREYLRETFWRK